MKSMLCGAALAAVLIGTAGGASAATSEPAKSQNCFRTSDWSGWHAPNDKTVYLRVNLHDIYRLDLSSPSSLLTWPNSHLVNEVHGFDYICSPLNMQLTVSQNGPGPRDFLFIKTMTKLTPEQVAALPKKDLP